MRNKVIGGGLLFGIAAFVYLFVQMQSLTSAAGNSYPLYSSLRSDPLGAKALHDALAETGEYQVSRSYKPLRAERAPKCPDPAAGYDIYRVEPQRRQTRRMGKNGAGRSPCSSSAPWFHAR